MKTYVNSNIARPKEEAMVKANKTAKGCKEQKREKQMDGKGRKSLEPFQSQDAKLRNLP